MPDVPDLSQAAAKARTGRELTEPACAAVHEDGECPGYPDAAGDAEEQAGPVPPQVLFAHTALLVIQTAEGETVLVDDINLPVAIARRPTRDEMYGMLRTAAKDIEVAESAAHTAQTVVATIEAKQKEALAAAQRAMEQQRQQAQNQEIERELARRGGIRAT